MTYRMLVPVDGSTAAMHAVEHAALLARAMGESFIHLVHAHEEPVLYGEIEVYVSRSKVEGMQRQHSESVLEHARAKLASGGIAHDTQVLTGPVASVIAETAEKLGCNAIVMGTHGTTGLQSLFMGSVASKVVHLSKLPVTLVK